MRAKVFLQMCIDAAEDPDHTYVVVIDELSRADPGRVFGEALTYIERSRPSRRRLWNRSSAAIPATVEVEESEPITTTGREGEKLTPSLAAAVPLTVASNTSRAPRSAAPCNWSNYPLMRTINPARVLKSVRSRSVPDNRLYGSTRQTDLLDGKPMSKPVQSFLAYFGALGTAWALLRDFGLEVEAGPARGRLRGRRAGGAAPPGDS
jgi:hypothetical protein